MWPSWRGSHQTIKTYGHVDTYKFLLLQKQDSYRFFQWIIGPETFDPQILLFLYDRNESSPLCSLKRWVPPPPNPPPMTDEENDEATTHRVCNPPACEYGYHAELVNPPVGLDYMLFFRCPIPLSVILDKRLYILLWSKYWVYVNDNDMCYVYDVDRCARIADLGGTTSKAWPPPRPEASNFPLSFFEIL
jgi:hypothetical protein